MRNIAEQAKILKPLFLTILSVVLFGVLAVAIIYPVISPESQIMLTISSNEIAAKILSWLKSYFIMIPLLIILNSVLVIFPVICTVKAFKNYYARSPFPNGLDKTRLKNEDLFIYDELVKCFIDGGLYIRKGFDSDEIYTKSNKHFATIGYLHKTMYVLIDRRILQASRFYFPDRSNYIPLHHAGDLPFATERIKQIYRRYFKALEKKK